MKYKNEQYLAPGDLIAIEDLYMMLYHIDDTKKKRYKGKLFYYVLSDTAVCVEASEYRQKFYLIKARKFVYHDLSTLDYHTNSLKKICGANDVKNW